MKVNPVKTQRLEVGEDLKSFLVKHLPKLEENNILVVTSKIAGLAEREVVDSAGDEDKVKKHQLVESQAEWYTSPSSSQYDVMLTIKNHVLAVNAGIDESNTGGYYVLWPQNPQQTVNELWTFLRDQYGLDNLGVILSDSKTFPLKWGVVGTAIAHCGFLALNDKRGTKDLFGRELKMTTVNVSEALSVAAVYTMGEADESTPLAIISEAEHVVFQDRVPTSNELKSLINNLEDDVYAPILKSAPWIRGGRG